MSETITCTRCGKNGVSISSENCPACTWPLTESGWRKTTIHISRITLDTSCINQKQADVHLNQIESWATSRLLTIERAKAMLAELKGKDRIEKAREMPRHPDLFTLGTSWLSGDDVLAGPEIPSDDLRRILFPTAKTLTPNQETDIQHLQEVVRTGSHCFVTLNSNDFIANGKRQRLAQQLGIWVFTPDEIVNLLHKLYSFPLDTG